MLLAEAFKRAAIKAGATFRHDTRVTGLRRHGNRIVGVKHVWSGLRPGTPDDLPILGAIEDVDGIINATEWFSHRNRGRPADC